MANLAELEAHLAGLGRLLVGYSGGVDSALLAVLARRAAGSERMLAVTGRSASLPDAQWQTARAVAQLFDVPMRDLATYELDDPRYLANPASRCFFCKEELWRRLEDVRRHLGFDVILDGTNADDLTEHRPGYRAGVEAGVRTPLADLGWGKADVRDAARALGLPIWNAPAAPCLSSRIRHGLPITRERLEQVEAGEAMLRALGVTGDLRVRHLGLVARIETAPEAFPVVEAHWPAIVQALIALGFERVERDPHGYRRGNLVSLAGRSP